MTRQPIAFTTLRVAILAIGAMSQAKAIVYVTAGGGDPLSRDGSSWMKAYNAQEIQIAIDQAVGDEVWVARGGYPAIQLRETTRIYGGFLGIEFLRSQRDPSANITLLAGGSNAYSVLAVPYFDQNGVQKFVSSVSVVDGFTIDGPFGVRLDQASPTISNCKIQFSGAQVGAFIGGIELLNAASANITDCEISDNNIGILVNGVPKGNPTITRCFLHDNKQGILQFANASKITVDSSRIGASSNGAVELQSDADFQNTIIENNSGPPVPALNLKLARDGQRLLFDHCTIRNNTTASNNGSGFAAYAGGVSITAAVPLTIPNPVVFTNTEISGNVSAGSAGGVNTSTAALFINCRITGNRAAFDGGGVLAQVFDRSFRSQFVGCLIAGNSAQQHGGGLFTTLAGPDMINTTIANNSASQGGAAYVTAPFGFTGDLATFSNTALTGNTAPQGSAAYYNNQVAGSLPPSLRNSAFLTSDTFVNTDTFHPWQPQSANGNLAVADPGYVNSAAGDFHLAPGSPLIDKGDNAAINPFIALWTPNDLDGNPRIAGPNVDIGAFEFQAGALPTDVTSLVLVTPGGFVYNHTTQRFVQQVSLTNIGATVLPGSISLVLDSISSNASLFNQNGLTAVMPPLGSPYINVTGSSLAPGASVTATLDFADPTKQVITYTPRVLAGPGAR